MLLFVRTREVKLGTERCRLGEIEDIRLFASKRVRRRRKRGKFARAMMELSVKSIASCWSCISRAYEHGTPLYSDIDTQTHLGYTKVFNCGYLVAFPMRMSFA